MKTSLLAAVSLTALSLGAPQAIAAGIDYGQLEQLFGEPVTTSAIGSPQRVSEAPVDMVIISANDIARSGSNNIPDILRHYAGIDVTRWASQSADVSIHGYNGPDAPAMLVLVNGRQVYLDHYGKTEWNAIPVQLGEIRQIEVVRGPAGALFGFNAAVGVINIITYDALYDDTNVVQVRAGTQNDFEASAVISHKFGDDFGVRLSGGWAGNDEFNQPVMPGLVPPPVPTNPHAHSVSLDMVGRPFDGLTVDFTANHSNTAEMEVSTAGRFHNTDYDTTSVGLSASYESDIGLWGFNAYHNWLDVRYLSPSTIRFLNEVTVVQLQDLFKLDADNTVRVAVEYRHNVLPGANNSALPDGSDLAYNLYAVSGMWNWKILDNLAFTAAGRLDSYHLGLAGPVPANNPALATRADFAKTIEAFSYNAGAMWQASDVDTFRVDTARALQIPGLVSQGFDSQATSGPVHYVISGTPNASPMVVTNYEVGYDRALPELGAKLRISVFYEHLKHLIAQFSGGYNGGTGTVADPLQYSFGQNIGDSSSLGLQLGLSGNVFDTLTYDVSYTLQHVNDSFVNTAPAGFLTYAADYEASTPESKINAHLGYTWNNFQADLFADFAGHTRGALGGSLLVPFQLVDIKANTTLSARVAYAVTDNVTVALEASNLGQDAVTYAASPAVERRIFGSVTARF